MMRKLNRSYKRGLSLDRICPFRLPPVIGALLLVLMAAPGFPASSDGCRDGGFSVLGLAGDQKRIVPAGKVPSTFLVKGRYVEFTVDADTFGVRDWTLTGVPNPL